MRDMPPIRSIEILGAEVRDQLAAQRTHFEALDAKAGVLLGFAGLLVALAPAHATPWGEAARLAGLVSAASSLLAFSPRDYPLVDLREFRTAYLTAAPEFTRLALLDTHLLMVEAASVLNDRKSRRLRTSIATLMAAMILAVIGLTVGPMAGGTP